MILASFFTDIVSGATGLITSIFNSFTERGNQALAWLIEKIGGSDAVGLGIKPPGSTGSAEWGVPVSSAQWQPWMHLGLPQQTIELANVWFPISEAVGAFYICLSFWALCTLAKMFRRFVPLI